MTSAAPITVRIPDSIRRIPGQTVQVTTPVATVAELLVALDVIEPGLGTESSDALYNVAVNGMVVLVNRDQTPLHPGDEVDFIPTFAGG